MRPAQVYATLTPSQHDELVTALHRQWRIAARVVIVLLSASGLSAPEIADLLYYGPTHNATLDRPTRPRRHRRPARPAPQRTARIGSPRLGQRIRTLLQNPKAWTTTRIWRAAGRPEMSLRTFYRRLRERVAELPPGSVVLAEDETHLDLLARVRACWMPTGLRHRILTPGSNTRSWPSSATTAAPTTVESPHGGWPNTHA